MKRDRRDPSHGSDDIVGIVALLVLMAGLVWLVIVQGCTGRTGQGHAPPLRRSTSDSE